MSGNECDKVEQQIQKYNNTSSTGFLSTFSSNEQSAECQCGCVIHMSTLTRTLSATTKGCPERSFWLIKVCLIFQNIGEDRCIVTLYNYMHTVCVFLDILDQVCPTFLKSRTTFDFFIYTDFVDTEQYLYCTYTLR